MIEAAARVLSCEGDTALVAAEPQGCAGCRALHGLFTRKQSPALRARNTPGATVGERVRIGIAPDALLAAALWLYGVPLAGFIAGAAAGSQIGDWQGVVGALLGLAGGLGWARSRAHTGHEAVILQRLAATEPVTHCPTALNVTFEERP